MPNARVIAVPRSARLGLVSANSQRTAILQILQHQTAAAHLDLERRLDLFNRVRTLAEYRQVLGRFYGIYAPLEPVLWRALAALKQELMLDSRRKAPLLSADLSACGLSNADIVGLPRWQAMEPFPAESQALGQLYVLEGATLGGQVMRRHFRKMLALKKDRGLAFFNSYGADVPERWRSFREVLARHVTTAKQQELAVKGANATFEMFKSWMPEGLEARQFAANR
jgi:heme oxygenase (biliverdin-IX-beta and delta-forming)